MLEADSDTHGGGPRNPDATENLPGRQAGTEKDLCEPALHRHFKRLSTKLGGGQLMTSAKTDATGHLKTLAEARCGGKPGGEMLNTLRPGALKQMTPMTLCCHKPARARVGSQPRLHKPQPLG